MAQKTRQKSNYYLEGTILAVASVFCRIIGLLYRRPLRGIIGEVGYGAHNQAAIIYNMALLLSTYSIPVCVSKLVAMYDGKKEYKNSYKLFKVSLAFSATIGFITSSIVFLFSKQLSRLAFSNDYTAIPLMALAPAIFIFAIMGNLRGLYQGKRTSYPTSWSQILEQIVHVSFGLFFAGFFMKKFSEESFVNAYGAAGATLGTVIGAVAALLFLTFIYVLYRPRLLRRVEKDVSGNEESNAKLLKLLVITMFPVVINQFLYSFSELLDEKMFNSIYAAKGMSETERLILSAKYTGGFRVLTGVPIAIASAMGVAAVTNVIRSFANNDIEESKKKIAGVIKFNMILAFPMAAGLCSLSSPIMTKIIGDDSDLASNMLKIGCISVVIYMYATATNSILQGINKMRRAVLHAVIGLGVYAIADFVMLKILDLSAIGLVIGNCIFPVAICVGNYIVIKKDTGYKQEWLKTFVIPAFSSVIMGVITSLVYKYSYFILKSQLISMLIAIMAAVLVYFVLIILLRGVSLEELRQMPKGHLLIKFGKKLHLFRE